MRQYNHVNELYHHGVKGMKWGIRKNRKQFSNRTPFDKIDLQHFAKKSNTRKTVYLTVREYAHVMSELRSNITPLEKTMNVIRKPIGEHIYVFENHFDDTYRVIGKRKIPKGATGLLGRNKYE